MYLRILHPVTGRFVAEYDPQRLLLLVVDRGHQSIIDLARLAHGTANHFGEAFRSQAAEAEPLDGDSTAQS